MNDFTDFPQSGEEYDSAAKMRDLREAKKRIGIGVVQSGIFIDEKKWWQGQTDIAMAARLSSLITNDDNAIEVVANMHVKGRPKLGEAATLVNIVDEPLRPLATDYRDAVQAQMRHKIQGSEAQDARDYSIMMRHYAMEYISYIRARGLYHLIRYYQEGGRRPRILDDV